LAYRNEGKIILTSKKLTDISLLPIVKKECRPLYFKYRNFEYVETSRGCPVKCPYCVESRLFSRVRFKPATNVLEEMQFHHGHKKKRITFVDSNFSLSENHVKNICELIKKEDIDFKTIFVQMHVDYTTLEMLKTMKNKGFYLSFGIESLSEDVLRNINKTSNPANYIKKCIRLLKFCKKLNLPVQSNYIVPLPGIKVYKIIKEIKLLQKISTVALSFLTPYPGTPLWEKYKDEIKNFDLNTFDCEHVILRNGMKDEVLRYIIRSSYSKWHLKNLIKVFKLFVP